jgi:hypothetical protein
MLFIFLFIFKHNLLSLVLYKAYTLCIVHRKGSGTTANTKLYAWAPLMVAHQNVLGKDYPWLQETLENPSIEAPTAFENLVQFCCAGVTASCCKST